MHREHPFLCAPQHSRHVGEVVLAMRIVGLEFLNVSEKCLDGKCVEAGVDLADLPLRRRAGFLLHDRLHVVTLCPGAENASISRGIFKMRAQESHGCPIALVEVA